MYRTLILGKPGYSSYMYKNVYLKKHLEYINQYSPHEELTLQCVFWKSFHCG